MAEELEPQDNPTVTSQAAEIAKQAAKGKVKQLLAKQGPKIISNVVPWLLLIWLVVGSLLGLASITNTYSSQACNLAQYETLKNASQDVQNQIGDTLESCGEYSSILSDGYVSTTGWTEPTHAFLSGRGGWFNSMCLTDSSPCPPYDRRDRMHKGVDLTTWECSAVENGQIRKVPIYAATDGIVESVQTGQVNSPGSGSYGNYAVIRHKDAFVKSILGGLVENKKDAVTVYAHMLAGSPIVAEKQAVVAGQVIGYMGNTGASTGCHLHFEIHADNILPQTAIDPVSFLLNNGIIIK